MLTTIPTTIITTIPTTILTTIATTIITTIPTTILTTIPTTIITIVPTNIITTTPTKIITTIPTTIITTIPTTIITTITTTIITSISTIIITTIPTTIITTIFNIPTTIITTYIYNPTEEIFISRNIKSKISTPESDLYNLCTSCNSEQQFFPAIFPESNFLHGFIECYNKSTKPINFYFDNSERLYKPCYETCLTCNQRGNEENHNCITCEINYIKKPEYPDTTNCVTKCFYSYYYNAYGQYKCTNNSNCPDEANLYIRGLRKCTDNCKNEGKYQFQYGGECLERCPENTSPNDKNICIDNNIDSCSKSENDIDLQEFLTSGGVDINAKNYAKEFGYTTNHVSFYFNSVYFILLYKELNCIEELSIKMPKFDFGECYSKVIECLNPPTNDKIIIALVEKANGQKKSTTSFSFYHPETGEKLDVDNICKDEDVIVKESVLSQLNNSEINLESLFYLTEQNINIFNLSDEFYTDICYHFDSPNGKDIPLQDRIKSFYPNITLCDTGYISKGVNLTTMENICQCKFNDLMNNDLIEGNALIQNTLGGLTDIISSSNILVIKCYKNVFKKENILKGSGGFLIISLALLELNFSFIFILYDMAVIRKYLYNLSEYFMLYIKNKNTINNNQNFEGDKKIKAPSKKSKNTKSKKGKLILKNDKDKKNKKYNDYNYSKSYNTIKSGSKMITRRKSIHKGSSQLFKKGNI